MDSLYQMTKKKPVNIPESDNCPACGVQWDYYVDGKRYSRVIGIYDQSRDRTVAWRCPNCDEQWAR